MDPLANLVEGRQGSPLSSIFNEPPKLVDQVGQPNTEDSPFSFADIFKPAQTLNKVVVPDEDDDEYIPLTKGEIQAKAASRSQMWGAVIALFFGFIHRYGAYQKLREGDKQLIRDHELEEKRTGSVPVYDPDHSYHKARERWNQFEKALELADAQATLSEDELSLLKTAIVADLEAKNKRKSLKPPSVLETMLEIMVIKAVGPAMEFSMGKINKMVDKNMAQ